MRFEEPDLCDRCHKPVHVRCRMPEHEACVCVKDFVILEDPSVEYEKSGHEAEVPGLYGSEAMQRALSIDFDGVLHSYSSGWQGHGSIIDDPVPGAVDACQRFVEAGWKLYVHTSRSQLDPVRIWLHGHQFPLMILTRIKPIAIAYIDDRAVRFEGDWESIRKLFV